MAVQVYGVNHIVIEVDDAEKAVAFYQDVFNLTMLREAKAQRGASWESINSWRFSKWKNCGRIASNILGSWSGMRIRLLKCERKSAESTDLHWNPIFGVISEILGGIGFR